MTEGMEHYFHIGGLNAVVSLDINQGKNAFSTQKEQTIFTPLTSSFVPVTVKTQSNNRSSSIDTFYSTKKMNK